ncbi:MAG TPA: IspD/TarI family cytidylyltransferase [Spirochaetia bacterium]|nr:IspD/TarI family cytidylyltransferase [Spirochaetia bacterium]
MTSHSVAAIVTAAGASRRMGGPVKKEYRDLDGVPVLARAILPFASSGIFERIVVTVPPGDVARVESLLKPHLDLLTLRLVEGGGTRQESVFLGLRALSTDPPGVVLVHDGARPWVDQDLIRRVIDATEAWGACVPVLEVTEAVKEVGDTGVILRHIPRRTIRLAQTPQGFLFERLFAAYRRACGEGASCADDGEVFDLFGGTVAWIRGSESNRKITVAADLERAGSGP